MKLTSLFLLIILFLQSCAFETGKSAAVSNTGKCYCLSLIPNQYEVAEETFAVYTGANRDDRRVTQKEIVLLPGSKSIGTDENGKKVLLTKSDSTARFWVVKDTNATKDFSLQTFVNYKLTQLGEGEQWSEILCPNKMTPELITQVQNALTKTGYYTGPIDGVVNSSTLHALTQFQIEKKLPGGISHIATLEALGVKY